MHDKSRPFLATITKRHLLSKPGTKRHTYHIELTLEGSGLRYNVGDSLGVFSSNHATLVDRTIAAMKAQGDEIVKDKKSQQPFTLREFLTHHANIGQFSRKVVQEVAARQTNAAKKEQLDQLLAASHHDALKAYQEQRHLWDLLEEHHEVTFAPDELCLLMMPLLPRLYSIASAQEAVGDAVHLTVSHLLYEANGHQRQGTATTFLCQSTALHQPIVPVYIQPHHGFTVPETPQTPIIMIGPGTGVAPFRAFMQQRTLQGGAGKSWLFFGEWQAAYDFYYEDFWAAAPQLRVTTAFSRDQAHKIYVQDRMLTHASEIYAWIQEGCVIYVCGDAHHMAKDVDAALHKIFETEGGMAAEEARKAVKQLRAEKRYLRDIY